MGFGPKLKTLKTLLTLPEFLSTFEFPQEKC